MCVLHSDDVVMLVLHPDDVVMCVLHSDGVTLGYLKKQHLYLNIPYVHCLIYH
jgi:hypothetical protein